MADPYNRRDTPQEYEETEHPSNPPNSVLNRDVRRTALRTYLGPVIVLFVIVGLALVYWANRGPVEPDPREDALVGTSGERDDIVGERGSAGETSDGFNPTERFDDTRDELEFRGVNEPGTALPGQSSEATLTDLRPLTDADGTRLIGRQIAVEDVAVVEAQDPTRFSIQDGSTTAWVVAPAGGPAVRAGSIVTISGVVEGDGQGGVRIRASRVTAD